MAIRHISTIFCDYLIRADNGRLSFIGTFRSIESPTLPITKAPMGVCIEFMADVGDHFKVSLEGNGINLVLGEGIFSPPHQPTVGQWIASIAAVIGVQFETVGVCEAILRSGDEI